MEKINALISPHSRILPTLISYSSFPISLSLPNPNKDVQKSYSRRSLTPSLLTPRPTRSRRTSSTHFRRLSCTRAASAVEHEPSLVVKNKAAEVSNELKGTSIFLVGMNGTTKTKVGKLLADVLRYYYFDSDSLIEQVAGGESAAKSFREKDEGGFRDSETEVLKQLSSMGRLVVCAGDGAVQSSTNLALLRYGISIWIDIPLDMLAKEAIESVGQCSQTWGISGSDTFSEALAKLTEVYEEMRGGYATADATVSLQKVASQLEYDDVEAVTAEDIAVEALKEIEKLTRVKKMMEEAARPF
ncbi:probable inactive shikimate kinase like 1, chloroplastic isoform X2 [Magnolia sinica]|uniref:probable inactive shikimate kinase like 1, chloroplastic isoform X2 n=1 Tax=Magnolia sinica TaxID=86752 RepID=UPI0026594714|nr:probable inactive shikimate kinase like 1, chloroplastic isoform X2 [Magnolia sinica]